MYLNHIKEPKPLLANIIVKVKNREELTPEEELVYLVYIEGLPEDKAIKLIFSWFDKEGFTYQSHWL